MEMMPSKRFIELSFTKGILEIPDAKQRQNGCSEP